jgi:hypothetical protein
MWCGSHDCRRQVLVFLLMAGACHSDLEPRPELADAALADGGPRTSVVDAAASTLAPTLDSVYQHMVRPRCGCHLVQPDPYGGLDLNREGLRQRLVGQPSRCNGSPLVIPGDPEGSVLVQKVAAPVRDMPALCGGPMPLSSPPVPREELEALRQWVADGAQE